MQEAYIKIAYYPGWDAGYVKEELDALRNDGQRIKAAVRIDADINKLGFSWPHFHTMNITVKSMSGYQPLMELKREVQNIAYRVFFCVKNDTIWLLHFIEKKSQKTPRADVILAHSRMLDVLKRF